MSSRAALALTDSALACDQNAFAEHINENAVNADARGKFCLQPADDFRHGIGCRLRGEQARNTVMAAEFCDLRLRCLVSAEHETWDLAGDQLVIHGDPALSCEPGEVRDLHVSDHLYTLIVEMCVESGELKRRTVHVRVGDNDLLAVQLRGQVLKSIFLLIQLL